MTASATIGAAAPSVRAVPGAREVLGKDDFLRLLVAQLQHQDPLNPADPTAFTAQLAQFSSLEQLFGVNERLQALASLGSDMEQLSALGLLGREVMAQSAGFRFGGAPVSLGYELSQPAAAVKLQVLDPDGRVVAVLPAAGLGPGRHFVTWGGQGLDGRSVPAGGYTLAVAAADQGGEAVSAQPLVRGRVSGVDLGAAGTLLVTSAGDFPLGSAKSVTEVQP